MTTGSPLLKTYQLGPLRLSNSIVMAPMTRSKATDELVPTEESATYYARRAEAGLIISEATIIQPNGQGYPNTPGIYTEAQIEGWRRVTARVHEKGGRIFLQIWHVGRVSHPVYLDGGQPVAPSAVALEGKVSRSNGLEYGTPRALELDELPEYVDAFARSASNAVAAEFDGVEIHGANGYLIDQFLHHSTNRRTDEYGGSPEKMARFAVEVVDAVTARIDRGRVGIRLSPGGYLNGVIPDKGDAVVFRYLLKKLEDRRLAYVHVGIFDDGSKFDILDGRATDFLRRNYHGTLIGNGSYTIAAAETALNDESFNLISIGRPFIANPDLVSRIRTGKTLADYDASMLRRLY